MTVRLPCILISMLCLLAVATSASAECAWVLWAIGRSEAIRSLDPGLSIRAAEMSQWSPYGGYRSKADCESAGRDKAALTRTVLTQHDVNDPAVRLVVQCLPDTVDPRGPKGK